MTTETITLELEDGELWMTRHDSDGNNDPATNLGDPEEARDDVPPEAWDRLDALIEEARESRDYAAAYRETVLGAWAAGRGNLGGR